MASKDLDRENRDSNPDPITKAPGSHPVATGVGAAAAGAAGAAIGSVVPGVGTVVGGVIGAVAGAVGGGYAGKAVGEAIDPTDTDAYWRDNHRTRDYVKGNASYDQYRPAYQYGATLAETSDSPDFDENRARTDWETRHGKDSGLDFESAKGAIKDEFNRRLKLREERLHIDKERVETGEVGIRKEVVTEQKSIEVPVEREEVVITRKNVRDATGDAGTIEDDEEIRIPVSEERVNVSKDTVVTGEVEVGKRKVTDTRTVADNLRKETVKVDNADNVRVDDKTNPQ
jgi:uncharacterized protein (TIGR02271 family)